MARLLCLVGMDFNPPAPCGAGHSRSDTTRGIENFNPPAPCGAGLWYTLTAHSPAGFQSTRPMRGGTIKRGSRSSSWIISIHPPHAGRDKITDRPKAGKGISIHPPHAGRDDKAWIKELQLDHFNPPAPCGAGQDNGQAKGRKRNFNPPAPCGAGR